MKTAPAIDGDAQRCQALHALDVLDTPAEARFDRLTALARKMFGVDIALVSLVDEHRQWFKSRQGLEATETERSISFCGHAIENKRLFVIEDTHQDDRFADNPLVTGAPFIRFYAGCPLKGPGGHLLGTLCIIDGKPRRFDDHDRDALRLLGELTEAELREPRQKEPDADALRSWLRSSRDRLSQPLGAGIIASGAVALVLLVASVWDREQMQDTQSLARQDAREFGQQLAARIETELNTRINLSYSLAGHVLARAELDTDGFEATAAQLMRQVPHVRSLQLAPDGVVTLVWPLEGNAAAIGHDLFADPARREVAMKTIAAQTLWLSPPINLLQGGQAVIARLPIFRPAGRGEADVFWGFSTVLIDLDALMAGFTSSAEQSGYRFSIVVDGTAYAGNLQAMTPMPELVPLAVSGESWNLAVLPVDGWPAGRPDQQRYWWLTLAVCVVLWWLVFSLMRLPAQTREAIRRATRDLQSSQSQFRDAIQTLPAGLVIFDQDDRLNICNERYRDLYAATRPRLQMGRSFEEILDYAIEHEQFALLQGLGETEREHFREVILQRHHMPSSAFEQQLSDGRWIRVVEERMGDGGTVSFHVDITEQKANMAALEDARQRAEQANQTKSTFLATISHEVRTPLNGVIGLLSVLQKQADLNPLQAGYVKTAQDSAQHLLSLLNEILDISKMEAGKFELEPADCRLMAIPEKSLDLVRAQAQDKGLELHSEYAGELDDVVVRCDASRLRQVLLNLLSNAIKFTDSGRVTLRLQCCALDAEHFSVRFEVEDTGIGFDQAQAERLFLPFDQLEVDAKRRFSGTGLGLTISKRLIEMMGGRIEAEGSPGRGACFRVDLKLPRGELKDAKRDQQQRIQVPADLGMEPIPLLLAEDSATNQLVIRAMLQNTGYALDVVENGQQALDALAEREYALVLMDIFMPEMDGVTATRALRQHYDARRLPVIALTANAMQGDGQNFMEAGMNEHLTKPLERDTLLEALQRWLLSERSDAGPQLESGVKDAG